ncbi:stage II sporulation protein M [Pyrococcus yayanosii]|uniref:stage II sporulation protein M n=1 Tax=Pyrococcus yayanosii TaxID=1008460 RepID=UPI00064F4057|nr:stage II sporulation protein M [Pyrococcus yayanosii]
MSRSAKLLLALLGTFMVGAVVGVMVARANPEFADSVVEGIRRLLGGGSKLPDGFELFLMIFLNNARVAAIMAFGGIAFGIVPFAVLLFNGMIVGIVVQHVIGTGEPLGKVLLTIVPHGVIEIPAFAIAGLGGLEWFLEVVEGKGKMEKRMKRGLKKMLRRLALSIALLFVAALVEAFVTPELAGVG